MLLWKSVILFPKTFNLQAGFGPRDACGRSFRNMDGLFPDGLPPELLSTAQNKLNIRNPDHVRNHHQRYI